jgi:regulatory protein
MDTSDKALETLKRFCAYQDRCHSETRARLGQLGLWGEEAERIICTLIEEDYLNEARFARSFARGKFRMKGWGRIRIARALEAKQLSAPCIREGLQEIDPEAYQQTLEKLARQKYASLRGERRLARQSKTIRYLLAKGYESSLISGVLDAIREDPDADEDHHPTPGPAF